MEKLTKTERDALIEKYAEDRLNMPPSNILDSTLVNSYGTDEQKARFTAAAEKKEKAAKAPKNTEKQAANADTQNAKETGENESNKGDTERYVQAFNKYADVFGAVPAENLTAEELEGLVTDYQNAEKDERDAAEQAAKANTSLKAGQVEIVSKATGEKVRVSEYTWENFIKKDDTHTLAVDTPEELKNK